MVLTKPHPIGSPPRVVDRLSSQGRQDPHWQAQGTGSTELNPISQLKVGLPSYRVTDTSSYGCPITREPT